MKQTLKPTIFFGSGPVAAKSLALLRVWHPVSLVVTKRTPPHHKEPAPVELYAKTNNLPITYADTKQELDELSLPDANYGIVIDYGVIISEHVIQHFPRGIINSHFSLLPQWRGADPITYALLSGQSQSGVSLMIIDKGMDTGPLIATKALPIAANDTNQTLTEKLLLLSDKLLQATLPRYVQSEVLPTPQPHTIATYSQKLTKQSGILNSNKLASELAREVRAFAGWPGSRLCYNNVWLTVTQAVASNLAVPVGTLVFHGSALHYGCKNGSLQITELQPAGKNKMSATAFYNGYAHKLSLTKM
ncbi:hypothetical protein KC871_02590 [Candidatus Saccharibacteria bacterium]|nr:hypothetical protein [Candidatus Saccharibacteria bacterium]